MNVDDVNDLLQSGLGMDFADLMEWTDTQVALLEALGGAKQDYLYSLLLDMSEKL